MYTNFTLNAKRMLSFMRTELDEVVDKFNNDYVYKKSLPLKPSEKGVKLGMQEEVYKKLYQIFYPQFDAILPLLEHGIVDYMMDNYGDFDLDANIDINEIFQQSLANLYIMTYVKYNITLTSITTLYLFFEQIVCDYLSNKKEKEITNIFQALKILEKDGVTFNDDNKNELNMYKHIINVYKHGHGASYESLKDNYSNILNKSADILYLFDLDKISMDKLYQVLINLLEEL